MKTKVAVLLASTLAWAAQGAPNLSIAFLGITNSNVYQEMAPTIRLTVRNETASHAEYVYWTTDLSIPKSQWVMVWAFTATGADAINLPVPPSYSQVYFIVQEQ